MTSDDQYFLDLLASVPSDIASYGNRIADYIEKQTIVLADELREWIPDSIRPPVRSVSHKFSAPAPPPTFLEKTSTWVSKNRTAIAVVLAFAGTTAILIYRRKKAHAKKRRARRDRNGKKKEIVVLACPSFHDPLTRSLALDLDRRGYIVYITVSSNEEDRLVQSEGKWDIRPLWMDMTSSVPNRGVDIHPNLEPIRQLIKPSSGSSSPGSDGSSQSSSFHHTLAGLVLLPGSTDYPTGPVATLPPTDLIDTVNTRLLSQVLTVQQFLPLLTIAENQPQLTTKPNTPSSPPSIILAYPSISTSLHPPDQSPESITTTALCSLMRTIRRELEPTSRITITELKLGIFDLGSMAPRAKAGEYVYPHSNDQDAQPTRNSALTHWHSSQRTAAVHGQQAGGSGNSSAGTKAVGSSLREFHNAVFDTLNPGPRFKAFGVVPWGGSGSGWRRGGMVYVGQGARLYDVIGKWVPEGLVGWLIRRQQGGDGAGTGPRHGQGAVVDGEGDGGLPKWGALSTSSNGESGVWQKI